MLKSVWAAGAAVALFSTLTYAAPFAHPDSSSVPPLSGSYVIAQHKFCEAELTVSTKSGDVTEISLSGKDSSESAGIIKFKQGSKAGAGSFTLDSTAAEGTSVLIKENSGTQGSKLSQSTQSVGGTFSQTSTKFSITQGGQTETYNVYYGKVSGGAVQYAAIVGIDSDGCAERATLSII
jgi:hypothetical protein